MRLSILNIVTKNWPIIVVGLLIIFLRFYRLPEFVTFLGDQGRDALIIKRIITLEHWPAIGAPSSIGGVYLGPFYYYFMVPYLLIFNYEPVGLAYGLAFLSSTFLISLIFVLQKESDKTTTLLFIIFAATCNVLVQLSRFSWNPNLLPYFAFFTLYFFIKLLTRKSYYYAVLFGSFLSFSIQLHYLAIFLIPPILITYLLFYKSKKTLPELRKQFLALGTFIFWLIPLFVFEIKHNFLNFKNLLLLFNQQNIITKTSILDRFLMTNNNFISYLVSFPLPNYLGLIIYFVVLVIFILLSSKQKISWLLTINTLNYLIYIIAISLLSSDQHPHYFGSIYLSFFFLLASIIKLNQKKIPLIILILFLIAIYVIVNAKNYYFIYGRANDQIKQAKKIAFSFEGKITRQPIQLVAIPSTETDSQYRYFLELKGIKILNHDSSEQPQELFVLCFQPNCQVLGNGQWQIASFSIRPPKIATSWRVGDVTIYKLTH